MEEKKTKKAKKVLTADQKKGRMFLKLAGVATVLTPFTGANHTLASIGVYYLTKGDKEKEKYEAMCKATGQMTLEELEDTQSENEEENTDDGELE